MTYTGEPAIALLLYQMGFRPKVLGRTKQPARVLADHVGDLLTFYHGMYSKTTYASASINKDGCRRVFLRRYPKDWDEYVHTGWVQGAVRHITHGFTPADIALIVEFVMEGESVEDISSVMDCANPERVAALAELIYTYREER